jgi:hypothetical protein
MFGLAKGSAALIIVGSFLSMTSVASAALCTNAGFGGANISGRVDATGATTNSGCQIGTTTSPHTPDPQTRANADLMFGYSDWVIISNPLYSPNSTSGSYNIGASFFSTYDRGLLLFQGADPADSLPQNYVGYLLLAANGTTGTWTSPFDDKDGCYYGYGCLNKVAYIKLLGHVTPPGANTPSPVPLPAPFLLLVTALGALGVSGWWTKRRALRVA